jgi:hypothetical protein
MKNKEMEKVLDKLSNMNTDVVSVFNTLDSIGISIVNENNGRTKDVGEVIKELAVVLKKKIK